MENNDDPRFSNGLLFELFEVLERHGYKKPEGQGSDRAMGQTLVAALRLTEAYEGRLRDEKAL